MQQKDKASFQQLGSPGPSPKGSALLGLKPVQEGVFYKFPPVTITGSQDGDRESASHRELLCSVLVTPFPPL